MLGNPGTLLHLQSLNASKNKLVEVPLLAQLGLRRLQLQENEIRSCINLGGVLGL